MRVLHVGPNSVHVISYIQALNKLDSVTSFLLTDSEINDKELHFKVEDLHSLNPIKIRQKLRSIKKLFVDFMPDVIHVHQVNRMGFWLVRLAKKMNIPVVVTAWGSDVLLMPQQNKLYYYLVKSTLSKAKIITADAQLMIDAMKKIAPNHKYVWLQYGIDPIEGKQKGNIIYSNRLHKPLYRIDKIVDLFAEFNKANPDWLLKIAATGSETDWLKQRVADYGIESKVQFVGWLSNEENRINYETAKIYISIPESDGTSVSLLEAMSAGCIPIVSDLPANREWIDNGKNGVIWEGLTNPIIKAMDLDANVVAATNLDLILRKATRSASLDQFTHLYEELINNKA